jgi:hypothetical protein
MPLDKAIASGKEHRKPYYHGLGGRDFWGWTNGRHKQRS